MKAKHNIRIAFADDHELFLTSVSEMLEGDGFDVTIQALNGKELIENLEKAKTIPDICILDVSMPVMNGLDTMIVLNKRWPEMQVLVLSMRDKHQIVTRMLMEGARGYLAKNSNPKLLTKSILAIYNNGVYFSELVTAQYWNAIQKGQIKLPSLSASEIQVLKYCSTDHTYQEIADELHTILTSITGHRDSMFKKLSLHSRTGLLLFAIENGIDLYGNFPDGSLENFYTKKAC